MNEVADVCEICETPKDCLSGITPCNLCNEFLAGQFKGLTPQEAQWEDIINGNYNL